MGICLFGWCTWYLLFCRLAGTYRCFWEMLEELMVKCLGLVVGLLVPELCFLWSVHSGVGSSCARVVFLWTQENGS